IVIPNNVLAIKNNAFDNCVSFTDITIPSSVTSMGANVFNNCDGALVITVMTNNNNTLNWNSAWLGSSGLSVESNVIYIAE
ncbi:MAG: leucine-rich repeat protein, partial [Bacilli bacterium]